MKQLLGVVLILALGLVVSHRWFGRAKLWGQSRFFYLTGEEFLLLGLLLGPSAANLIDAETLASLEPFVGLGLGYVGFVFGMQFRAVDLAGVPRRHYAASAAQTAIGAGLLLVPLYLVLERVAPPGVQVWPLALAVTATAVGSSTSFLFLLDRRTRLGRSPLFRFMKFSATFDDLWAVALFTVALCWMRTDGAAWGAAAATARWLAVSAALGLVSGAFLQWTDRMALSAREELLVLMGIVLFSGGVAGYLKLSPIFTNLVAGALFCNRCRESPRYHDLLLTVEKPIYLFMLILAGASWEIQFRGAWAVLAVYLLVRALGKILGGRAAAAALAAPPGTGAALGFGLTAQSEMAVALMVNLLLFYHDPLTRVAVSAVFLAVLANDLASSAYYARNYRRT